MKSRPLSLILLSLLLFEAGCGSYKRVGLAPAQAAAIEQSLCRRDLKLPPETEQAILALDPEHVSEAQVRRVLAWAPAPRIINIHGGVYSVYLGMVSFSEFLIGMGYPGASIANPGDDTYTFSCYESSEMIAGVIAWYYEREGLRPIIVGHSQGGMQTVKVLRKLAGLSNHNLHLWNPLTWSQEEACEFVDPLTGKKQPVVGLKLPYATASGAGGLTRILPNQWDMCGVLRDVPDSAEEFTGFWKHKDLLGGDNLGYGAGNYFKAMDRAVVRNVQLPSYYKHGAIPDTKHLLESQKITDWINSYHPPNEPKVSLTLDREFDSDSKHILWAGEVWYSIKKHWVLELQRLIRSRQIQSRGN